MSNNTTDSMDELLEIIDELRSDQNIELTNDNIEMFANKLHAVYQDVEFRHSYATISKALADLFDEQRVVIFETLDQVLFYMDNREEFVTTKKKVGKLADHIELETIRLSRMDEIKLVGSKTSSDKEEIMIAVNTANEEIARARESIDGFLAQVVSVLGIFAGIVITFSVSTGLATETFSNIDSLNFYKTLFYLLALGFILFNVIFMMMYMISKIAKYNLAVKCRNKECYKCTEKCLAVARLNKKYPYVFWFNLFIIVFMVTIFTVMLNKGML